MNDATYETHLPLRHRRQGKVRDIYEIPAEGDQPSRLLIIATDRLSAYDVVMPTPFPGKGRLLTDISMRWFRWIEGRDFVPHHVISDDAADIPIDDKDRGGLDGRVMICRRAEVVPIECVARGYLAGSGWKEYQKTQSVCGVALPAGLRQCDKLPEPIFTPATKATEGHDENVSIERAGEIVGDALMARLRDLTLRLYTEAAEYAAERGIIIADTKFEFGFAIDDQGRRTDELLLIDEIFTPDSSRFWPMDEYEPGRDQVSFDKQYVRNYLEGRVADGQWDKTPPGPEIPDEVVRNTLRKYEEARDRLFG
ncbi:MAG: phosphoribosylaminoimidazolesuccinocarboxamide synthase [Phycisphaerales bacterium]